MPIEKEAAKERQREHGGTAPGIHSGKVSPSEPDRTRNKIGAFAGQTGCDLRRIDGLL